ncbi:hypothetical protein KEM60_00295 [Austwickia sp. TVS 96-490-7B]|uniref:GNAT family N-acetyltransferase n=1 Tax=Austwickia sp. TVS 96-490-7B TaxID=2830843 RepID=UPI001C588781|nr:GNAT family N-acetyltransferase [Austwickia sp. TVS 96-490-7B]MBW3084112.1 hypothetical protein [Austwickia sp. TVS 96-490-7B]
MTGQTGAMVLTGRAGRALAAGYVSRLACVDDAATMAALHVDVWRATYTGVMRQEVLDALDPVAAAERWRNFMGSAAWDRTVWVGVDPQGEVVAMASAGPARDDDAPTHHELRAINVSPRAQGSGLADLMMRDLVGDDPAYLWVVESNARAIAFYARHGFIAHDRRWDESCGVHELRMVR